MESRGLYPETTGEAGSTLSAQGRYFRAIEERVGQIPGVRAAGSRPGCTSNSLRIVWAFPGKPQIR